MAIVVDDTGSDGYDEANYRDLRSIAETLGVAMFKDCPAEVRRLKAEVEALRQKCGLDEAQTPLEGIDVTDPAGRELHLLSGARAPITMIAELANPLEVAPPFGPRNNLVIVRVPDNCYVGVMKERK